MQTTIKGTILNQDNYDFFIIELDKFVLHYNKVKKNLYKDIIKIYRNNNIFELDKSQKNELKSTYQIKYDINARHFNSIFIEVMGKIKSVLELNKEYIVITKNKKL